MAGAPRQCELCTVSRRELGPGFGEFGYLVGFLEGLQCSSFDHLSRFISFATAQRGALRATSLFNQLIARRMRASWALSDTDQGIGPPLPASIDLMIVPDADGMPVSRWRPVLGAARRLGCGGPRFGRAALSAGAAV